MHLASITESVSTDVFERRTSIESKAFSLLICLDAIKFVLPSVFTLIETICPQIWAKPLPKNSESPLSVGMRCSKTPLLKLPNEMIETVVRTDLKTALTNGRVAN